MCLLCLSQGKRGSRVCLCFMCPPSCALSQPVDPQLCSARPLFLRIRMPSHADPVLERSNTLRKTYVPNDLDLTPTAALQILNGPNNSGELWCGLSTQVPRLFSRASIVACTLVCIHNVTVGRQVHLLAADGTAGDHGPPGVLHSRPHSAHQGNRSPVHQGECRYRPHLGPNSR